jgi:hypothetical protein
MGLGYMFECFRRRHCACGSTRKKMRRWWGAEGIPQTISSAELIFQDKDGGIL